MIQKPYPRPNLSKLPISNLTVMKNIVILSVFILYTSSMLWAQEGITLTQGNKAYYRLTVSGNRSYSDGPWFFGTTVCDRGMQEIRFYDKSDNWVKTVNTGGKTGGFQYNTGNEEFTKDQFPIKVHIDNKFVDRLLCKGWAIYDFPKSWYTDDFRNRGMNVIKVEYNRACNSRGYSGFWQPDNRYYGDIFYYHAAYVYMRDLEVRSEPIVQIQVPTGPLYLASEEYLTIGVPDNLLNGYTYYWKYKIGSDQNYRYISNRYVTVQNGQKVLRIKGEDFLPTSAYGKRIRLELDTGCRASNPISFTYYPSAPRVTDIQKVDPVCFQGDGQVKIYFGRNLNNTLQEKLTINLKDNLGVKYSSGILSTFHKESDDRYSYTFNGVKADQYQIEFAGGNLTLNGERFSTIVRDPADPVEIQDPSQVIYDITIKNSSCNDGDKDIYNNNDGRIDISASGGRPGVFQYAVRKVGATVPIIWEDFDTADMHTLVDLQPGNYEIQVRKKVGDQYCTGYFAGDLSLATITETISEPAMTLNVEQIFHKEPAAHGFTDGKISYLIKGGTAFDNGSYAFEIKNSMGLIQNTVHTEVLENDEGYVVTLHSVGADIYTLRVTDKNYNEATYKTGCFEENISYNLQQPDPIQVVFEITNPVSCNINNRYSDGRDFEPPYDIPDQFQDGQIVAHVTGGVIYDTSTPIGSLDNIPRNEEGKKLPYYYSWKKKVNNVWTNIGVNDSIISNQSSGDYALNVADKNGIILGTYTSFINSNGEIEYRLATAIDSTLYLSQPEPLAISFENTDIGCFSGSDATAKAFVTGGIPPYQFYWSNGSVSDTAINLRAGKHLIYVTDSKGCVIEGSVTIEQPNGLEINRINEVSPTCYQGNDGFIEVEVEGGHPPYTFLWNTGATSTEITDLTEGTYTLEITDQMGCKAFYEAILEDPPQVEVVLKEKHALCQGQALALDVAIEDPLATYDWTSTSGFVSNNSFVIIDQSGVYTAKVTNGVGCSNEAVIEVEVFDNAIDAHYLIATQAYVNQEVTLVNISEPIGDRVEWEIPETHVSVVSENEDELTLLFDKEGTYEINLRSHVGECYEDFSKKIIVQPAIETYKPSSNDSFVKEFILFPNPNNGTFQTKIALEKPSEISVKIIHLSSGAVLDEKKGNDNVEFLFDNTMTLPSGMYLVILETSRGTSRRKLVIK